MKEYLSIPEKIRVGFQERSDTYTGKLAFVISMGDGSRENMPKSWENWRDKGIDPKDFDNKPISGFVLNKDVGGVQASYGWNARREKIRVYDPRDFEFEITVENVLLILQECTSVKGKGLEGDFILSWSGNQIVLLPVCCSEYRNSIERQNLGKKQCTKEDMVEGCTYLTKKNVNVLYLGCHAWSSGISVHVDLSSEPTIFQKPKKQHVFLNMDAIESGRKINESNYLLEKGFTSIAVRTSSDPVTQYAKEYEKLMKSHFVSKPVKLITKPIVLKNTIFSEQYRYIHTFGVEKDNKIMIGYVCLYSDQNSSWDNRWRFNCDKSFTERKYDFVCAHTITVVKGKVVVTKMEEPYEKEEMSYKNIIALTSDVYVVFENGSELKINNY